MNPLGHLGRWLKLHLAVKRKDGAWRIGEVPTAARAYRGPLKRRGGGREGKGSAVVKPGAVDIGTVVMAATDQQRRCSSGPRGEPEM